MVYMLKIYKMRSSGNGLYVNDLYDEELWQWFIC